MRPLTLKSFSIVCGIFLKVCLNLGDCFTLEADNDPNDDIEVFSSKETTIHSVSLPEEAFSPKIESIFIKTKIRFRYAKTRITSTIVNPNKKKSQNVNYTLRIPSEAFITRRINNDPKIYRAKVVKTEEAQTMYEFAVGEGRSVSLGLLEQSELDFSTVLLKFVVGVNTKVLFSLIYEERLPRIDDKYESVVYLVPDYVVIEENLRITSISVPLDEEYAHHNATITRKSATKATIVWSNFNQGAVKWKYPENEFTVLYSLENEISTGHVLLRNGYFVHFFAPTGLPPLRKHVIFILDVSDSMTGLKMNQTISAMTEILDELKPEDFFNIITFSSEVKIWSNFIAKKDRERLLPFPASQCKEKASYDIHNIEPSGSTNMYDALVKGLEVARNVSPVHSPPRPQKLERYQPKRKSHPSIKDTFNDTLPPDVQSLIIFFTDGDPTSGVVDKRAILSKVKVINAELKVPIFSLAFGESADFAFLSRLSTRNGAFARKIYENADPEFQLADFYREISNPVLAKLSFKYEAPTGTLFSDGESFTSSGYSMAFKGQEILTLGRLNDWPGKNTTQFGSGMNATISGVGRSGTTIISRIPIKDCSRPGMCIEEGDLDDKCVEKLFVYLTMKNLLDEVLIRESEKDLDEESKEEIDRLKEKIIQLALKNELITPYTSMVMRTKSTREQEMDVEQPPLYDSDNPEQSEVEIFLGSESSLPDNSKAVREFNLEPFKYDISSVKPKSKRNFNGVDASLKFRENYKLFEISNSSIFNHSINSILPSHLTDNSNSTSLIEMLKNFGFKVPNQA